MTKADLVERAADAVGPGVIKKDCGLVVDAFLDSVKDALERGEGVEIRGFGTFKVRRRKPRTARDSRTGELVEIPASERLWSCLSSAARTVTGSARNRGPARSA